MDWKLTQVKTSPFARLGKSDDKAQHCATQANVSDNCRCSVFKVMQIKCLYFVFFLNTKAKLHTHRTLQPLTPKVSSKSRVNSFFGYMFQLFIKASFVMFFITQDV